MNAFFIEHFRTTASGYIGTISIYTRSFTTEVPTKQKSFISISVINDFYICIFAIPLNSGVLIENKKIFFCWYGTGLQAKILFTISGYQNNLKDKFT